MGKVVGTTLYLHKSAVDTLPSDLFNKYNTHLKAMLNEMEFDFDVIAISKSDVHFVQCSEWDTEDEPIVEDRVAVWQINDEWKVELRHAPVNNPFIYHHKHLFVNSDYQGFNVDENKLRTHRIELAIHTECLSGVSRKDITTRMGRLDYWEKFCKKHSL